jgi:hypothetical protein
MNQALANAGDAHLLTRRRCGGDGEQVSRQPVTLRSFLLGGALDRWPPARRQHCGNGEHGQKQERGMNRRQQRHGYAQAQDPPQGGKQRHVHVVQDEYLVAQHRQAVEIFRTLVVRDRFHRCLQPGHMGFKRDGHLVAEAALHPGAEGAQKPGCRGGDTEADGRDLDPGDAVLEHAFTQQPQPQGEQGIGQRGQLRQDEGRDHQAGLMAIAQLA